MRKLFQIGSGSAAGGTAVHVVGFNLRSWTGFPDNILNWNFEKMADTAITLVSIAVGVYIAAVSALLGSPYAKELKQETDKKKTGNTLLGTLQDYFRCAGKFGVVTIIVSCLYCIPSTYIIPARIMRIGSAIAYGVFSCNILFLWLVFIFLVNSLEKSV